MSDPVPMLLWCPQCTERHIDEGEFATKPHHTHACQGCGLVWRPAIGPTCGVRFLPGFKNAVVAAMSAPAPAETRQHCTDRGWDAGLYEAARICDQNPDSRADAVALLIRKRTMDPATPDPRDAELAKLRAVAEAAARLQRWNYDGDSSYQEGVDSRAELSSALDAACPGWRDKEAGR